MPASHVSGQHRISASLVYMYKARRCCWTFQGATSCQRCCAGSTKPVDSWALTLQLPRWQCRLKVNSRWVAELGRWHADY
jgi:hypothetical protein